MGKYSDDAMMDAYGKVETSRLNECLKSLRTMRKAQDELEKHVYGFLNLVFLFRTTANCVSCRDGIIEDTTEKIKDELDFVSSADPHSDAAEMKPQAGHLNVAGDYHSSGSSSYSSGLGSYSSDSGSFSSGLGSYSSGLGSSSSGSGSFDET